MSNNNMGVLNQKGLIVIAGKDLLITVALFMMLVIVLVFIVLVKFAWRYREWNTKAHHAPNWHNNVALEVIWLCIPSVIVVILAVITWKSTHDLDPYKPIVSNLTPVMVQVVTLDWKRVFIYLEEGVATVNFVQFPKKRPVDFIITSDAPMNGYWIPQLEVKSMRWLV